MAFSPKRLIKRLKAAIRPARRWTSFIHAGLAREVIALIFFRVSFNAPVRNQETQELPCGNTKYTLGRVKHHLVNPEIIKGFSKIIYQGLLLPRFNHDIIHIGMNVAPNLVMKTILNTMLINCLGTLEPKRHRHIEEGSKRSNKSRLLLVLNCHLDLMITRISIQETQTLTTRRSINNLINTREGKGISWASLVQIC